MQNIGGRVRINEIERLCEEYDCKKSDDMERNEVKGKTSLQIHSFPYKTVIESIKTTYPQHCTCFLEVSTSAQRNIISYSQGICQPTLCYLQTKYCSWFHISFLSATSHTTSQIPKSTRDSSKSYESQLSRWKRSFSFPEDRDIKHHI